MVPTFLTNLALGVLTSTVATIMGLSAWLPGSQIIQGNLFFDSTNNANPGLYINSLKILGFTGSASVPSALVFDSSNSQAACRDYGGRLIDCYQQVAFTNTGACLAAGCTGAGKSYHVASITKPYSGSGVIKRVDVTCDDLGVSSTLYAAQVTAASTISGTNVLTKKTIGSGSVVISSTGSLVWAEGTPAIRVYAGTRLGTKSDQCAIGIWSDEVYNP